LNAVEKTVFSKKKENLYSGNFFLEFRIWKAGLCLKEEV